MQRRGNLAHLFLASVVVLGLMLLTVCVDAQAQIAFSSTRDGNREIYVMDIHGKNQHRLTDNPASDWSPSWAPDGKRIAFTSTRHGNVEIYVMDADGKNQRRLTKNRLDDWSPSWSPDGKRIAFSSFRGGTSDIYVMDADGDNQRNLTKHGSHDFDPAWYTPPLAVAPVPVTGSSQTGKKLTMWGWVKQID